jgi:hypothetical protein
MPSRFSRDRHASSSHRKRSRSRSNVKTASFADDNDAKVEIVIKNEKIRGFRSAVSRARISQLYAGRLHRGGEIRKLLCKLLNIAINDKTLSPHGFIQLEASGHIKIIENGRTIKSFVALLNMYKRMTFVPVYAEMMDESSVPVSTVIHHMKSNTEFEKRPLFVTMITTIKNLKNWCRTRFGEDLVSS